MVPPQAETAQERAERVATRLRRLNEVLRSSRNDTICQCNVSETNYKIITIFFIEQHKTSDLPGLFAQQLVLQSDC